MRCPKCGEQQTDANTVCSSCGIVFAKFYKYNPPPDTDNQPAIHDHTVHDGTDSGPGLADIHPVSRFKQRLFLDSSDQDIVYVCARGLLLAGMLILSYKLLTSTITSNYVGEIFLHNINLVFHEAGHIVFRLFGQFIATLGGSLGQILMPAVCCYAFLFRSTNPFAAAVCFWWVGENFIDISPYINDANAGVLPLLGGNYGHTAPYGFHDWEYLLTESGLIKHDHLIARMSFFTGAIIMLLALVWGGVLLRRQFKATRRK